MKYPCLVLDHDDTVVMSTPDVHYPSFLEAMKLLRPDMQVPTLSAFIRASCDPGILVYFTDVVGLSDEEMVIEQRIWRQHTQVSLPEPYEGFGQLLKRYRKTGGKVCVVSHSHRDNIERHYAAQFGFVPDMTFGWERPEHERKPHPFPLQRIMDEFALSPKSILMVDDLKPGMDMAMSAGVDFAWAGWSHTAPVVSDFMHAHAQYRFDTVKALEAFLFDESPF